eukprot:TRINITY_DN81636_c0_g1_i1.p1 TRINITY_DN81636_c0_g1~~TRINITY_DN81636_c0_g1_i1.p1  ORF type:complete len:382 (-),score=53.01 TRINITY_DN81636_c0_g1_i1:73-1188(-)
MTTLPDVASSSSAAYWKIVGGSKEGGILVRSGQDTSSSQLSERLSKGSLVEELELVGDRLHYRALTGEGPNSGWVSTKLSSGGKLAVQVGKEEVAPILESMPLLVLLPSGGMMKEQGEKQFKAFLDTAARSGFKDHLILHHFPEPPLDSCKDYQELTLALAKKIDENPLYRGRKIVLIGHSLGTTRAYGLAKVLKDRCIKFYAVACRPPSLPIFDEVFGVKSYAELDTLKDEEILRSMVGAWRNKILESFKDREPEKWPKFVTDVLSGFRRQYCSACTPAGSKDLHEVLGDEPEISTPIFAIAANQELQLGETPERCERYAELTTGGFQFEVVEGDHFGCIQLPEGQVTSPLFDILIKDLWGISAQQQTEN